MGLNRYVEDGEFSNDDEDWRIEDGELLSYDGFEEEKVTVPDGVKTVCSYSFYGSKMKSVFLPKSVEVLQDEAFENCENLTTLYIENENIVIEQDALCFVDALKEIYFGGVAAEYVISNADGKKCLEKYLVNKEHVEIERGIAVINMSAFIACDKLKSVVIPDTVEKICVAAFAECTGVKELRIPKSVEVLERMIFQDWTEDQTIYVPSQFRKFKFLQPWRRECKAKVIYY